MISAIPRYHSASEVNGRLTKAHKRLVSFSIFVQRPKETLLRALLATSFVGGRCAPLLQPPRSVAHHVTFPIHASRAPSRHLVSRPQRQKRLEATLVLRHTRDSGNDRHHTCKSRRFRLFSAVFTTFCITSFLPASHSYSLSRRQSSDGCHHGCPIQGPSRPGGANGAAGA